MSESAENLSNNESNGKTVVLTGVKPTGTPHLGNYLGAIRPAIELSRTPNTETWLFIADYHSLITVHDSKKLQEMTYDLAATWIASGLDPKQAVFYRQSDVPEILELNWILSCFTPKGLMNRAHAYKAKVAENQADGKTDLDFGVSMGLYSYPVLMAADILMFNADKIPVGDDQVQHIEIARDIAQKFNRQYGMVLRLPNYVVQKTNHNVPGLDGRKMSKSYDNCISIYEESPRLKKLVARIKTDSLPPEAPKEVKGSILFDLYQAFATPAQIEDLRVQYAKGVGWGTVKEQLFQIIDHYIAPKRDEYKRLMADRSYLDELLSAGALKARETAAGNLKTIRKAIGVGN